MPRTALTPKQEAFAQAIAARERPLDAYRTAFNNLTASNAVITVRASELKRRPLVAARIMELQTKAADRSVLDLERHLRELKQLRDEALVARQFSAAITAEISRGKAAGLYVDTKKLIGDPDAPIEHRVTLKVPGLAEAIAAVREKRAK